MFHHEVFWRPFAVKDEAVACSKSRPNPSFQRYASASQRCRTVRWGQEFDTYPKRVRMAYLGEQFHNVAQVGLTETIHDLDFDIGSFCSNYKPQGSFFSATETCLDA
jgi:hypothetical protein